MQTKPFSNIYVSDYIISFGETSWWFSVLFMCYWQTLLLKDHKNLLVGGVQAGEPRPVGEVPPARHRDDYHQGGQVHYLNGDYTQFLRNILLVIVNTTS